MFVHALLRSGSVKRIDVLGWDINTVEELFLQGAQIAHRCVRGQRIILVSHKDHDIMEAQAFLFVHANQLVEHFCQGCTAGKSHRAGTDFLLALADGLGDFKSDFRSSFFGTCINFCWQFFKACQNAAFDVSAGTIVAG